MKSMYRTPDTVKSVCGFIKAKGASSSSVISVTDSCAIMKPASYEGGICSRVCASACALFQCKGGVENEK
jgi:hypothetical protein